VGGGERRQRHCERLAEPDGDRAANWVQAVAATEKRRWARAAKRQRYGTFARREIDNKHISEEREFEGRVATACPADERA
jgi:hypothetical protein